MPDRGMTNRRARSVQKYTVFDSGSLAEVVVGSDSNEHTKPSVRADDSTLPVAVGMRYDRLLPHATTCSLLIRKGVPG